MNKIQLLTPEMRLRYLLRRMDELAGSDQKLQERDFDFFKNIGHQIKGNASTFEFPILTALAVSLEESASVKNGRETARVVESLKVAVQGLLNQMQTQVQKDA